MSNDFLRSAYHLLASTDWSTFQEFFLASDFSPSHPRLSAQLIRPQNKKVSLWKNTELEQRKKTSSHHFAVCVEKLPINNFSCSEKTFFGVERGRKLREVFLLLLFFETPECGWGASALVKTPTSNAEGMLKVGCMRRCGPKFWGTTKAH